MMKQFYATISMLPEERLRKISYTMDGSGRSDFMPASFPAIPMLEAELSGGEEYELYLIWTKDDNERFRHCRERFGKELKELSGRLGFEIKVTGELGIPHNESRSKHIGFFRELCRTFRRGSQIYMDVTYGTKITSISCFASLAYAENVMDCDIRSVIYGKFSHVEGAAGTLFDVRCLYELNGLIYNASAINGFDMDKMLDMFGREEDDDIGFKSMEFSAQGVQERDLRLFSGGPGRE